MNTKQILTGIQEASCRDELSTHLDLITQAVQSNQCGYDRLEDQHIAQAVCDKLNEFNGTNVSLRRKTMDNLQKGSKYNFKSQPESLIYLGNN